METLGCGHAETAAPVRFCPHLLGVKEVNTARCLRGVATEYDLACPACKVLFKDGEAVEWISVCVNCYDTWFEDAWDFEWVGEAQIVEFPTPFDATITERDLPLLEGAIFGVAGDGRVFAWAGGELLEIGEETRVLMALEWPDEPEPTRNTISLERRLALSKSGRFAALVNDRGQFGVVVDLEARAVTLQLNRGDYHPEQTPFPLAFFESNGRELVVHGTDWNRLDVSDPQTGELLSIRESPRYEENVRPTHYLDYFHGRLHVSPRGEWILDDGWVWHPVGMPVWWNLTKWVGENVWESEDGATRRDKIYRDYHWNVPMCWIGENRVAVSGLGEDDLAMIAGARIFGVAGEELLAFAGPSGEFWSDDTRLFSAGEDGLSIWNVETGARTGFIEGFCPQFGVEGALVEINEGNLRRWDYAGDSGG